MSVLVIAGAAWAHLAVELDRIKRQGRVHGRCIKRVRIRLASVESWLPKMRNHPPDSIGK